MLQRFPPLIRWTAVDQQQFIVLSGGPWLVAEALCENTSPLPSDLRLHVLPPCGQYRPLPPHRGRCCSRRCLGSQLIDSGATKQQGVVKKLTHDYGFLRSLSCPETVYFNTAHVVQSREGERLRVGSQVKPTPHRVFCRSCLASCFVVGGGVVVQYMDVGNYLSLAPTLFSQGSFFSLEVEKASANRT